jgi:hypothetical protein
LNEDDSLMDVRIAVILVGCLTALTLLTGLAEGFVLGGLLGQDLGMLRPCGWIQGAVGGVLFCGAHFLFAVVQGVVWIGLMLRQPWARFLGMMLALLYSCSIFFPLGFIMFFVLLTSKEAFLGSTIEKEPVGSE